MKLIIDIPEETYQDVVKNGFIYDEDGEEISHAIINSTPIPDNATNGDVIKALFEPNINKRHNGEDIEAYYFDEVWWNSPYQKGGKE